EVVAKRKPASEQLVLTAGEAQLKGPVQRFVRERWRAYEVELKAAEQQARKQQGGRAPDFGEPSAVQAALAGGVDAVLALLDSTRELRVGVVSGDDTWSLRAKLTPGNSGAAHDLVLEQVTGSAEPLTRLPNNTQLVLLTRSSAKERAKSAAELAGQLKALFGARLSEEEQARLTRGLSLLAGGRGDATMLGLVLGSDPRLIVQGPACDAEGLQAAM